MISVPSAMNVRVVIRYDEPKAVLSIRSAKLIKNLALIASDLTEKKTVQTVRKSKYNVPNVTESVTPHACGAAA